MKKKIMKSTLAVALVAAATFGGAKTYGAYAPVSQSDLLLSENVEALSYDSDPGSGGGTIVKNAVKQLTHLGWSGASKIATWVYLIGGIISSTWDEQVAYLAWSAPIKYEKSRTTTTDAKGNTTVHIEYGHYKICEEHSGEGAGNCTVKGQTEYID